jgi:NADH dehydrogenase [ubiquinone] 1 alpha subcomplex assembly factor 7
MADLAGAERPACYDTRVSNLRQRIVDAIRTNGPMSVSLYMLMCLHDPREGYYATRPGFNADFTTAPETSQVFGELLGLWVAHEWMRLGKPRKIWIIELGPGRGTMMADMLRAADSVRGFSAAAEIALVEASPALRRAQEDRLEPRPLRHFDELEDVPPGPAIIIGNEFLDCMAIRQFIRNHGEWRERQIGLVAPDKLTFGVGPAAEMPKDLVPVGDQVEVAPAMESLVETIARRFRQNPGRALFIDYGSTERSPGDSLRAFRQGIQVDPLADPGMCDLTADVDFPRMKKIGESEGLAVHGPIQQGYFLTRLGARERAQSLGRANPARADEISAAVQKLIAPEQMGSRFKAICFTPYGVDAPPGF